MTRRALAAHPSIDPRGMKCMCCGHALTSHNTLGYCGRAIDGKRLADGSRASTCEGSCNWLYGMNDYETLARMKKWDEEHGAGKVRRRMEARGESTEGVFW